MDQDLSGGKLNLVRTAAPDPLG